MAEEKSLESFLTVGCPMVLHPAPSDSSGTRYSTALRGWCKSSYLLIDRPRVGNRFAAIRENEPCIVRFLSSGLACAFDTIILDWDMRQYHSYCRIGWPEKFQTVAFRKFERVKAQIPCQFSYQQNVCEGVVEDISIGGCRIRTNSPIEGNPCLSLNLTLPDGSSLRQIRTDVRNVRNVAEEFLLGCQFQEGQTEVESDIAFYVSTVLERGESRAADKPRILIIEENRTLSTVLRNVFEQNGFEAVLTLSTLDGLSRLRMSSPTAVLISQKMPDLPALQSVSLIRATRGLETLPVFLYGGALAEDEAARVGVTGHLDSRVPAIQVAKRVLSQLEKMAKP